MAGKRIEEVPVLNTKTIKKLSHNSHLYDAICVVLIRYVSIRKGL